MDNVLKEELGPLYVGLRDFQPVPTFRGGRTSAPSKGKPWKILRWRSDYGLPTLKVEGPLKILLGLPTPMRVSTRSLEPYIACLDWLDEDALILAPCRTELSVLNIDKTNGRSIHIIIYCPRHTIHLPVYISCNTLHWKARTYSSKSSSPDPYFPSAAT